MVEVHAVSDFQLFTFQDPPDLPEAQRAQLVALVLQDPLAMRATRVPLVELGPPGRWALSHLMGLLAQPETRAHSTL